MSSVNSPSSADSFQVPPFPPFPATQRYVAVGSQEEAFSRVRTAIDAFEAISLVIGPPGTGKTLIASMLGKHFGDRRQVVTLGETSIGSSVALMRYLNHQLTKPHDAPSMDFPTEDALQLAVIAALTAGGVSHPGWLLLIDEAQTLAPEVLDTIRMLTNVMVNDRPAVSAVLFGGPKLDETLALPSLESLVQRVATRCYLHAFSPDETIQYVHRVIRACGSNPADTIDESTVRMLHRACGGVPRLINQLMTASIDAAAASGQSLIDGNVIDRAWAMLQQLPGPVVDEPAMSQPSSVEFGPLTDFDPQSTSDSSHDDRSGGLVADSGLIESDPYNDDLQCEPVNSVGDLAVNEDGTPDVEAAPADETLAQLDLGSVSIDCNLTASSDTLVFDTLSLPAAADATEPSKTPDASELFGDFDDEQAVGSDAASEKLVFKMDRDVPNLEASLHEEVLSLRGEATESVRMSSEESAETIESANDAAIEEPNVMVTSAAGIGGIHLSGQQSGSVEDDRDLLIIEDDVCVDGGELQYESPTTQSDGETVSVDFQSMLAKMRHPNA